MKKVLPLAIATALTAGLSAPMTVMADATVYGKMHIAVENMSLDDDNLCRDAVALAGDIGVDIDQSNLSDWCNLERWQIENRNSRLGIKGSEDLGDGLKAIYKLEFAVNPVEDGEGGLVKGRNQYVGLAGDFGTALVGRHDTPLKMSQGKFDQFNDTVADIKDVIPGEDRIGNVIAYVSPNLSGFTAVGAIVAGENGDGDPDELTGLADHYSLAGMYSNGPFYAALAYNSYDLGKAIDGISPSPSLWRGTFVYSADMFSVGAMYSNFEYDINGQSDSAAWGLSGSFKVGGNGKIKAQYLQGDNPVGKIGDVVSFTPNVTLPLPIELLSEGTIEDAETTQWTVGYDYSFSKRTTLYALYNAMQVEIANYDLTEDTFAIGMIHNF
jgi:predicted porin